MYTIHHDPDVENPRTSYDHLGTLAILNHCGDEEPDPNFDLSDTIWLPVYRYEHGGIVFSTEPFSCPWDSGRTGYIYAPKGAEGLSEDQILSVLKSEVEEYSQWANGETYGFVISEDDSCWGFIGYDNCREAAMAAVQ